MDSTLLQRIRQCPNLPTIPAIALEVLELAQRDQVDLTEIARAIGRDPALSSKLLRTANSSFYARSQSISTINHALVILGLQSVKTLVLGFSLVTTLSQNKAKGFSHIEYWRRSIYSATAARTLAMRLQIVQQEECFLAALLKDIGMVVLDAVLGAEYGKVHEGVALHSQLCDAEQKALGTTHAEVSSILANDWHLPPVLAVPMSHHHSPESVPDTVEPTLRRLAEVVALSDRCADIFVDPEPAPAIADVRRACEQKYNISPADCDAMMDEISSRTKEAASLFEINLAGAANYESILKKANEALVDLTLRTQQQAVNLERVNSELMAAATIDALTGLANRGTFNRFLSEQFLGARASGRPLSLLMIDVDKFKTINDSKGHQIGDEVLSHIGKLLRGAARSEDLAARYGGEELALVMPGTARATAAAIAESIRRGLAAKPLMTAVGAVPVTISIGVATADKESPIRIVAQLIKAADMAVYAAKHAGRNCVKVFASKAAAPPEPVKVSA